MDLPKYNEINRVQLCGTICFPAGRKKPNGDLLNWQTVSFAQGMTTELPFFIRWDNVVNSPAKNSPRGCKLNHLSVYTCNLTDLKNIVGKLTIPINIQEAKKTKEERG